MLLSIVELLDVHLETGSYFIPYVPFASISYTGEIKVFWTIPLSISSSNALTLYAETGSNYWQMFMFELGGTYHGSSSNI